MASHSKVLSIDLSKKRVSDLLEALKLQPEKKPVELTGWLYEESEVRIFLQCLPYISQLSVYGQETTKFLGKLICEAAEQEEETGVKILELLYSVCNFKTFPLIDWHDDWYHRKYQCNVLLDLYSYVKNYETQTGRSLLPALQPVYQSAPTVWSIDLSEKKVSLLLEVMKLQPEKKPVELTGWSYEESEVRLFLQCLPYISQLSVAHEWSGTADTTEFLGKLICEAAEWEEETGEKILELLYSVCNYKTFPFIDWHDDWKHREYQCDILLDLYSYVKNYETQTGRCILPALQPVYQSVPAVWSIDLSERKVSLLLEVMKLQPEKKPVELTGWSVEENEVKIFLQCLPYISQLSVADGRSGTSETTKFLGKLICEAAEQEEETREKILESLYSVCNYKTFPLIDCRDWGYRKQCALLLDLYSYVKNYETQTGRSVLLALQPVYQSVPTVWSIDLSERKVSLLLEVLKLQPEKKPVKLTGWSDEESEVRIFLQCLPYISQLSVDGWSGTSAKILGKLICEAAEREETGVKILELFYSVCNYKTFPLIDCDDDWRNRMYQCDILLYLYSYVKNYETQTGRSLLPLLQPVYQSVPTVWSIDLSERKVSLLLEVLKLQPEKKPVELTGWSKRESEVRIFLQCLPYISQLRCSKSLVLQLLSLVSEGSERNTVMRAVSLAGALGGELDLSETRLDQKACRCLALVLEHSGLTELDLSYCQLTDQLLEMLIPHLHKAQVLDLSYNNLTDALTDRLVQLLSINTSIQTVRLFNNCFKDTTPFLKDKRFEMMEADSGHDDVASITPYEKQLEGPSSQNSLQEIVPPSVALVSPHLPMLPSPSVSQQSSQHSPEEMSCDTACDFSTTDHPVTVSLSSPHPSLELQGETDDLSRCFSGLRMGESSSLPRSHSLPSLSQIPCKENKAKGPRSLNDVTLLDKTQKITPDIIVVKNKECYRFHCTQAGLFQCSVTGLVFKMKAEKDVTYRTVPWNQMLQAHLGKRPAGPLFDLKCPQGSVCQLHLPHCEILSMGGGKSLSVVHVMDDGIEFIKPDVITETHVIINVTEFSPLGVVITGVKELVKSFFNSPAPSPIRALVLPFYTPPIDDNPRSILKVLLLPGNVVLDEVLNVRRKRHGEEIYIEVPPCQLIPKQEYTLSTSPQEDSIIIQPKKATFEVDEASYTNYMATFDVISKERFRNDVRLLLKPLSQSHEMPVADSNTSDSAWECYIPLSAPALRRQQDERTLGRPVEDRLFSVQSSLIESISAPSLKCVVDKLFEKRVLTDSEQEEANGMQAKEDKARFVINTVRRKGSAASSLMILNICDIDPFLAGNLGLM